MRQRIVLFFSYIKATGMARGMKGISRLVEKYLNVHLLELVLDSSLLSLHSVSGTSGLPEWLFTW